MGRLRVQACVKYYGWVGSACGPQAQSGADTVNSVTLRPSLSEWGTSNQHHFPYLRAVLPPPDDGRTSKLYGYYLY